ncbi:hypothetical protein BDW22DRAFT_1358610 [Trametopsis cervina]|nr:hypothetical protein BDW22DRAFT_1358610 [Trametopsis cervina]
MEEDTDTLMALVSSLLDQPVNDQSLLLDALAQSEGNVQHAADMLNKRGHGNTGCTDEPQRHKLGSPAVKTSTKRKRTIGLDKWLVSKDGPMTNPDASCSPKKKSRIQRTPSPAPRLVESEFVQGSTRSSASPTKVKPVSQTEFMSILRPPNSTERPAKLAPPKLPPLTLGTPALVEKHTPCTMHLSVLPPELACRLYYAMLDESENWQRNKWWLFDRVVESPHSTSFYIRRSRTEKGDNMKEAAQFWYNGRPTPPPDYFPSAMEEACQYVERVVNAELRKRKPFPLEWGGCPATSDDLALEPQEEDKLVWRANVAASNRYEGSAESVGLHSDQLTYLGPYPTIASLSLGTTRVFRLREVIPTDEKEVRSARTYNIPLPHNSLTIMHASCQETFKHSIPPQTVIDPFHPPYPPTDHRSDSPGKSGPSYNSRINITFRFYRPDFQPSSIPRCQCNVPCILRPDMKNRYTTSEVDREKSIPVKYWWTCYAGAQNDGKGCNFWKTMDARAEGRGPFAEDTLVPE